jgi:pilus assembly protein Flp/PilA
MELIRTIQAFMREEDGVAAIEYALIASLIAVAAITGASALGSNLNIMFSTLAGRMKG